MLSAVGIHLADIVQEAQEPAADELTHQQLTQLTDRLDRLAAAAVDKLQQQGFNDKQITTEKFLNLRSVWCSAMLFWLVILCCGCVALLDILLNN